jgi:hypothetical protein
MTLRDLNVSRRAALSAVTPTPQSDCMQYIRRLRRDIERLPAYPSLCLVVAPLAVVEPLKLATIFIAGSGHWITGAIGMLCAYAVSLFVTHWLFAIVKPKLLTLPWFVAVWKWLVTVWHRVLRAANYAFG